ncbi:MAG: TonB-dependent receptor, partial [Gemmatimonadota bacterium]|nr:TonB-dependent receptor [Gemmatimonadota bacterium]
MRRTLSLMVAVAGVAIASPLQAQSGRSVTGTVTGPGGQPQSGAMVVALALPDSTLTQWATTGGDGAFRVGPLAPGDYLLQVTLIGHRTIRNPFTMAGEDVVVGAVELEVMAVEIEDLVVTVDHVPFLNRRDPLAYNALAFQTRPNATVEDLLRRLPGIEVDGDGSITAQGEEVQNVLVDGREFFGDDPTVATQNLRADAVERVEVFDKESDMAEFTGIADGQEERTINLELREDARNGYFGQMSGGAGADMGDYGTELPVEIGGPPEDRIPYAGSLNINRFSPTTQLALIGNANNVNQQGFGRAGFDGPPGGGRGGGGGGGNGFTESLAAGLNASHDFSDDNWLRTSYFLNRRDNLQNSASEEERLLGSEVASEIDRIGEDRSDNWNHRLNLNSQVEFADGHDLRLRGNIGVASGTSASNTLQTQTVMGEPLNSAATSNDTETDDFSTDGRLTWRKRLNSDGRSLVAEARLNYGDSDQLTDLTQIIDGDPSDTRVGTDIFQEQEIAGQTLNHSVRLSWTEPFGGGKVLEVFGERNAIDEDQAQTVFDLEDESPVFNPILSSAFDRVYTYLRGGFRFSQNTQNTRWVLGLQVQDSD